MQVHDRAQVFISCPVNDHGGRPVYAGKIERWSNKALQLPDLKCVSKSSLYVLVNALSFFLQIFFHVLSQKYLPLIRCLCSYLANCLLNYKQCFLQKYEFSIVAFCLSDICYDFDLLFFSPAFPYSSLNLCS